MSAEAEPAGNLISTNSKFRSDSKGDHDDRQWHTPFGDERFFATTHRLSSLNLAQTLTEELGAGQPEISGACVCVNWRDAPARWILSESPSQKAQQCA